MNMVNKKIRMLCLVGGILITVVLLCSFFGERGLVNVMSLKKELKEIECSNQKVREENDALEKCMYLLKNDKGYIERIAREELGLVKGDEMIYLFENN